MNFTTTIQGSGNKTGIEVPEHVVEGLGAGRRPPVVVTMAAMAAEPAAQERYATLSYSAQRRYLEPLDNATAPETRARGIAKVVSDFKAGKK
jgi:hypothetical protein